MVARAPIVNNSGHRPMAAGDTVDVQFMPFSTQAGNQLRTVNGGLYVGNVPALSQVYVDSINGVDTAAGGSLAAPFKTLNYALAAIAPSLAYLGTNIQIFLRAGQTFPLSSRVVLNTEVTLNIGFYGDARGDYTTVVGGATGVPLWALSDVDRPIIQSVAAQNSAGLWSCGGITAPSGVGAIRLYGVQVNAASTLTPTSPPAIDTYGEADVLVVRHLSMFGAIGNKPDTSPYGIYGVLSRTQGRLDQFASQFTIREITINTPPSSTVTAADLVARQHCIHFYPDFAATTFAQGAVRLSPSALSGANSSGTLVLNWSDVSSQSAQNTTTLGTFPVLSDTSYGLTNYFYGLRRDQQARPLNVISGRLF